MSVADQRSARRRQRLRYKLANMRRMDVIMAEERDKAARVAKSKGKKK